MIKLWQPMCSVRNWPIHQNTSAQSAPSMDPHSTAAPLPLVSSSKLVKFSFFLDLILNIRWWLVYFKLMICKTQADGVGKLMIIAMHCHDHHHHCQHYNHHHHHPKMIWKTQADGGREASAVNISYILNSFQIGYDRRVRPNYGGIPVTVGVTLYILSIGDLSEKV